MTDKKRRKTALITGAAKGIGKQIAYSMAEAGYDIIVNYRSDRESAEKICGDVASLGIKAISVYADMSKMEDIRKMYEQIFEEFEVVDVLVNNAGISEEVYFLDATEEMFDRMTRIDWKGVFFCSQIAAKKMIEQGIKGCWPRATIYASTKAAVSKFTKNAAMELSPYGIRMAAIAPGYTDVGWQPGDIRLEAAERLPFKRFATTKEVAEGVVYLASDNAAYITGTTLVMDGGATLPVVAANDFVEG